MEVPDPIKYMESKGMTVSSLSEEDQKAFAEAARPVYEKWTDVIGKDIYEKALADMAR